jgi:hypothetical protein
VTLEALHESLTVLLEKVRAHFKGNSKVTFVIRNPGAPGDAGVVITNDDLDEAILEIRRRQLADVRTTTSTATPMQQATLEYMREQMCIRGMPPTVRELADYFGVGPQAIMDRLRALQKKGLVHHEPRVQRGWRPA